MLRRLNYYKQRLFRKISRKLRVLNTVTLSQSALKYNLDFFKKLHPESKVCPVLKSNAYGHGLVEIAKIVDQYDVPYIIVDSFYEAFKLRKAGVKTPSLVIGYTHPDNYKYTSFKNIAVTVMDRETVEALGKLNENIKIHLKIDTGMRRQGIQVEETGEVVKLIQNYPKLELEGIFTHLADSDNPDNIDWNQVQVKNFKKALKIAKQCGANPKWKHISATAGAAKIFSKEFNMIRIGLGLYGQSSLDPSDKYYKKYHFEKLKPVLSFDSTIIDIKELEKGDCVSYGCTFIADRKMKIGVIPAGYYEGVDRRLSNKGFMYCKGKPCKILGRVCMNLTVIDLSNVKISAKWDKVNVIGTSRDEANNVEQIAKTTKTIPYVIWTHISPTIRRIVK
ncbi:alanine racemase [Patescibacteria group bacterium]|nr:alanine racemase [Patescibacteria group bacterium]